MKTPTLRPGHRALTLGLGLLAACGGETAPPSVVATETAVVHTLELVRESPRGVSLGFDLDDAQSDGRDHRSCFKEDYEAPDGTPGIDNQLALLLPLIDLAGENAVQSLVQNAINEGRLLILFDVMSMDDGSLALTMRRGDDVPLLGTDNRVLAGQTLALHAEPSLSTTTALRRVGNQLEAGPFSLQIPILIFTQLYLISMPAGRVRFDLDADGRITGGVLGGGIPMPVLIRVLETASNFGPEFEELFGDAVRDAADLARDESGVCREMSAAVRFEAAPAFVYGE
jgi:hypothetical protein